MDEYVWQTAVAATQEFAASHLPSLYLSCVTKSVTSSSVHVVIPRMRANTITDPQQQPTPRKI